MPVVSLALFSDAYSHPVLVQRMRFCEIEYVNLDLALIEILWTVVADTEIEPLVVASGVSVHSHVAVVFPGFGADHHV